MSGVLGLASGGLLSPATFAGSLVREARLFHPNGLTFFGHTVLLPVPPSLLPLQASIAPRFVTMRFSGGWWKSSLTRPDVLGIGMRILDLTHPPADPGTHPGDQDLLFESFDHLYKLPTAPFTTNVHNYFANMYHAILPFRVPALGTVRWRVRPAPSGPVPVLADRNLTLRNAVTILGIGTFVLEIQPAGTPTWTPLVGLQLFPIPDIDSLVPGYSAKLSLNPFQAGASIMPRGYFNGARAISYVTSQIGRHLVGA